MTVFPSFLRPGTRIVYTVPLYGGTQRFIHELLEPFGIGAASVVAGDGRALDEAIGAAPDLGAVFIETPSNPTMVMTDIRRAVATTAQHAPRDGRRPLVVVDNTFLGPTFQHPLNLGADIVVYSATKYLSGFSDMLGGVVLTRDPSRIKTVRATRVMFGNILQPDECWMLDGRLPTVALRMNRQSKNAQRIAERLAKHPSVLKMHYPTLFDDPEQARIRDAQCDFPGAVFSMELGGRDAAFEFLRGVKIARNAFSLGGVETLACHPKTTTHSGLSPQEWETAGITDGLVRVSVGVEDWRDVLEDFEQVLDAI